MSTMRTVRTLPYLTSFDEARDLARHVGCTDARPERPLCYATTIEYVLDLSPPIAQRVESVIFRHHGVVIVQWDRVLSDNLTRNRVTANDCGCVSAATYARLNRLAGVLRFSRRTTDHGEREGWAYEPITRRNRRMDRPPYGIGGEPLTIAEDGVPILPRVTDKMIAPA